MINEQPIQKQDLCPYGTLEVNSFFLTIQGEGPFVGFPAVFVRLQGCNLQCPMCDTEYSTGSAMSVDEIIHNIRAFTEKPYLVVITGGEPFRQNIAPLVVQLLNLGYPVQIETNGTLYVPGPWDRVSIVCSPKTPKLNKDLVPYITAYKYVVNEGAISFIDGLPTSILGRWDGGLLPARPHSEDVPVYLQPADTKEEHLNKKNREEAVECCLVHGHIFCLQVHKILGME